MLRCDVPWHNLGESMNDQGVGAAERIGVLEKRFAWVGLL